MDVISKTMSELAALERRLDELKAESELLERRRKYLSFHLLPGQLAELGTTIFDDGRYRATVKYAAFGSFPRPERDGQEAVEYALDELRRRGALDLVHTTVQVQFAATEHAVADTCFKTLRSDYPTAQRSVGVHSSTLRAWAVKEFEEGRPFDVERIGLDVRPRVTVKEVK